MSSRHPELKLRLSGYLYLSQAAAEVRQALYMSDPFLRSLGRRELSNMPEFLFPSPKPCFGEDAMGNPGPYDYPFAYWELPWACAFLTLNGQVALQLERVLVNPMLGVHVSLTTAKIHQMLEHVLTKEDGLSVSFVHAHTRSNKRALSSLSYYGDDLKRSSRFLRDLSTFRAQTIRIIDATLGGPILTIGVDGFISFPEARIKDVLMLLAVFRNLGYFVAEKHKERKHSFHHEGNP